MPRYWIIDLDGPEILVYDLSGTGGFNEIARFGPNDQADLDAGPARAVLRLIDLLR